MSATRIVLIGGGEHARVVAEALRTRSELFHLLGFLDPGLCEETRQRLGLERLGDDGWASDHGDVCFAWGIGDPPGRNRRSEILSRLDCDPTRWPAIVHAAAWLSPTARVEPGVQILAGAVVQSGACLGPHSLVNTAAVVEHDVELGEFAQVAPGAVLGGRSTVGARAYVGLGARVRDHIRIGADSVVGMGAVVVSDVPSNTRVLGVPAKSQA